MDGRYNGAMDQSLLRWGVRALGVAGLVVCCALTASCRPAPASNAVAATPANISVYFSPRGGCTQAVCDAVGQARRTLDVQAYSFTSAPIAQAVAQAQLRGVKVRVVLDKSQRSERYSAATYLLNHQVPTYIDSRHAIAHNKVMIIDGQTVITGSFNFTKAAEDSNAENLLILHDMPDLAERYTRNFELHLAHSEPYTGPVRGTRPASDDAG